MWGFREPMPAQYRLFTTEGRLLLLAIVAAHWTRAFSITPLDSASLIMMDIDNVANVVPTAVQARIVQNPDINMKLHAGVRYMVQLVQNTSDAGISASSNPRFRVVFADATSCQSALDDRYVASDWSTTAGAAVSYNAATGGASGFRLSSAVPLVFNMGGAYNLCFSSVGGFGSGGTSYIVPVKILVKGVYDFVSVLPLSQRPYYCYLRKKAYYGYNSATGTYNDTDTSCRVWFGYYNEQNVSYMQPYEGDKGSWSGAFTLDPATRVVQPQACGTTMAADFICNAPTVPGSQGACSVGSRFVTPADPTERTVRIPTVSNTLTGADFRARTVAACYCPGFMNCNQTSAFRQQIGLLHFYLSKVCQPGVSRCPTDYTGVTAQYRFKIVVQCPTTACRAQQSTRMKLIHSDPADDLPSWMSNNGCRTGIHGKIQIYPNQYIMALRSFQTIPFATAGIHQPFVPPASPLTTNPTSCQNITGCPQSGSGVTPSTGGLEAQDYKEFGGDTGFQFTMGNTNHEARNFYNSYIVDMCYCNQDCTSMSNWFKSGEMRLSPTRLVSSATSQSNLPAQWSLEFVNQPGIIGIFRSYDDENTLGLQANGMLVKIVRDMPYDGDIPTYADMKCWQSGYDSQLISGPSDSGAASFNYPGKAVAPETQRIVFNAGFVARTITASSAGRVAVCYCALLDASGLCGNGGDVSPNWRLLAYVGMKGPKLLPQQLWEFSTNIVFRFSYAGYGLSSYDSLRIIDSSGNCYDDNYNPNRAAYVYTSLRTGCPEMCNKTTINIGSNPGDLSTIVRSADCSAFDPKNTNCVVNDIVEVVVLSTSETQLLFQSAHGFADGDQITLGENIYCDPTDTVCTPEALDALRGVYQFQDVDNQDYQAPSTYSTPHRVLTVSGDPMRVRIQIGWPAPQPQFLVIFQGSNPALQIQGRGGKWTHHTKGYTKEEVMGDAPKSNLKVCWSYGRPEAPGVVTYVQQVGLLSITDPAVMEGATISLSTVKLGQPAPMILQFQTASSVQVGLRYDNAVDSLRLKMIFTHPNLLDLHKTGIDAPLIPYDEVVPYAQASQQTCGMLILELWSEDMENGFPLPMGCAYRSFAGANPRREVEMIFEAMSGPRKNTIYQIVFNAHIQDVLDPLTHTLLQDTFMQLTTMDDVSSRPYEAIEWGDVTLSRRIPQPDPLQASPQFNPTSGFKIVGGYNNLLELQSGDSLIVEIMGGQSQGNLISAGCRIRIFLWPFTQWQTTSSCTAGCITGGETSFKCDFIKCDAEAVVPGMSLNVVKLTLGTLGSTWDGFGDLYGNQKVRIRVSAITMPSGGFWAERLAAQVTDAGISELTDTLDAFPHYVISVGDLIWKAPTAGTTVAKVISQAGGGNARPFKQDVDNVLYARLMLSSTLLARDDTGRDASLTITLPAGYTCKQPPAGTTNYWAAPITLPAFQGQAPQGRGTPEDGTINHGWTASANTCTFVPTHPFGVIYAGCSIIVRITVNNPTFPLPSGSSANIWSMVSSSRGLCGSSLCVKQGQDRSYNFVVSPDTYYQSNNVVLGKILRASIQPANFNLRGPRDTSQALRIFFQTEQPIIGGGSIVVDTPPSFNFNFPCNASDLEESYYATTGNPASATLKLPVDRSGGFPCQTLQQTPIGGGASYQQVRVRLTDILSGGRYYGFKVQVDNPSDATVYAQDGWRIYTADSQGYLVDGTPTTVPFINGDVNSWGVYASNTVGFRASLQVDAQQRLVIGGSPVLDMRPYVMSTRAVYMTFQMVNVPQGTSGLIRLTAPDGYKWDITGPQLVFREEDDPYLLDATLQAHAPPNITAPFPPCVVANAGATSCPVTRVSDTVIVFQSAFFSQSEIYGFAAPIRVPVRNPTTSSNAFFFELGYSESVVSQRKAAAYIPVPDVRALKNAVVGYTTSIRGTETALQIYLQTVTDIPLGGYIQILAPLGFVFAIDCYLLRVGDSQAPDPPPLTCRYQLTDLGPQIWLTAVTQIVRASRFAFAILADTPKQTVHNFQNPSTDCGMDLCWFFNTYRVTSSGREDLDYATSAQGFSINDGMVEARIPPLTSVQNYATGRDDRPQQRNNVIFAFSLSYDATFSGNLALRGPPGFTFTEDCTGGVNVDEATIFGLGNRFPDEFTEWPQGVAVKSCRGAGTIARLNFTIAAGAKFVANRLYLVRVGNLTNPLTTPVPNRWTLELTSGFSGQASQPVEGMTLWAFTNTKLTAIDTAFDQTLAGQVRTPNPLRILFRPYNTIPQQGEIWMLAPDGFEFVSLPSRECHVELQELPYVYLGVNYAGYTWPQSLLVCLVDASNSAKAAIRLMDPRPVTQGLNYELILIVYNTRVQSTSPAVWTLQSYLPGNLSLDASQVVGFVVNDVMVFQYTNWDPANPTQEVRNGRAQLPNFILKMQFPDALQAGDKIVIIVPADFTFTDTNWHDGRCLNFAYVCEAGSLRPGQACTGPLSQPPVCNGTEATITFLATDYPSIPQETLIQFTMDFINPPRTMALKDNFWRCTHYGPPVAYNLNQGFRWREGANANLPIKSSKAFQSWDIVPQMEQVSVAIVQPGNLAAGSTSAIVVSFMPVTAAQDIAIQFLTPAGFEFDAATVDSAVPAQDLLFPDSGGAIARVRTEVVAGQLVTVTLRGVRLGQDGGQSTVQLTSWTGGLLDNGAWRPGTKQDERLACAAGCSFFLAGAVLITYDKLANEYQMNPGQFPVQSRWEAQMNRPATITFSFSFTQGVQVNDELWIYGLPYQPTLSTFSLATAPPIVLAAGQTDDAAARAVNTRIKDVLGRKLKVVMLQPLAPSTSYQVIFSVIAPAPVAASTHVGPITWTIESWTYPYGQSPTNTNDGISREFTVVEEYNFMVQTAIQAPPDAEVQVQLSVTPGLKAPTALLIVAPLLFNFSSNCLAFGGQFVTSCSPATAMPNGQKTARLLVRAPGLTKAASDIVIKVTTPTKAPLSKAWFVEGLDQFTDAQFGWGQADGFNIQQMSATTAEYPGIPGIQARIVWHFQTQVLVEAGGWLHAMLPDGFVPECKAASLQAIALPTSGGCRILDAQNVLVYINSTITPGEYAFAFQVTPPTLPPLRNLLSLVLKDSAGNVRDAAVDIPGQPIQDKLKVQELAMTWSSAKALRSSVITVGFQALEQLPDLVVAPDQQISEVLIVLPQGFTHLVSTRSDFTLLNEDMPLRSGQWLDYMQADRLRVTLNLNRSSWTTLKAGRYQFRFPVLVPTPLPTFNVWHLCLCSPNYPQGCNLITDPAVMVVFAMPGFQLGQVYGASSGGTSLGLTSYAASWRYSGWAALVAPLLLLLVMPAGPASWAA